MKSLVRRALSCDSVILFDFSRLGIKIQESNAIPLYGILK